MNELKQRAIRRCYAKLVDCLNPLRVMDHLADLLSLEEMELIRKSHLTSQERTRELIAILLRKGEELRPFDCFIEALEETDENHKTMAEAILKTYEYNNVGVLTKVPRTSLPDVENTEHGLQIVQHSLKQMYMTRFQKVYPFSLPFTFDIEKTWVSLALKEYNKELNSLPFTFDIEKTWVSLAMKEYYKELDAASYFTHPLRRPLWGIEEDMKNSQAAEDHAELLKKAFDKVKMLIIEGDPATGKSSLMRRLAFEWAKGKQELLHYDLVLYVEFREVREKTFQSIADLVLYYCTNTLLKKVGCKELEQLMNNEQFIEERRILLLLDGYDESSLDKQCSEFSSYVKGKTIQKPLFFHTVITTRKGYLSDLKGREGRFVFAEVLGFVTAQQKRTYIFNHFKSAEFNNKRNIAAVHSLLANNKNINNLAETPLFLTFICLVHERITDGTLLELYCNIIWWLIDRHQQDFPDRDIPALFGFQNGSDDKFETIQDHYLHFPQLHCLGKTALHKLKESVLKPSDCAQFNLQPIIEQVGLLRKEKKYDEALKLATSFHFPHRTIQEFLAACYCFCSNDPTNEWLLPDSKLNTSSNTMNEFEGFLFRIALSYKIPIQAEKRIYYFDRITDMVLDMTFDAFNTAAGFNFKMLNWFLTQCTNVQRITLYGKLNNARHARNMVNETPVYNKSAVTLQMTSQTVFSFSDLIKLHSVTFSYFIFEASSQLSFTNCPSLKNMEFIGCEIESTANFNIETLPAIDTVKFSICKFNLATWKSITEQISNSFVKFFKLDFGKFQSERISVGEEFNKEFLIHLQKCKNVKNMDIMIRKYEICQNNSFSINNLTMLQSLVLEECTLEANSQLSFANCPSLKNLEFRVCAIDSSANLGIATPSTIDTMGFYECKIDFEAWQLITDQIRNSSVKCLKLSINYFTTVTSPEFLHELQQCERIEQIHIRNNYITHAYEEEVTTNLVQTAQKSLGLQCITISDEFGRSLNASRRLKETTKERIEIAGKQRNPNFSVKYVE